MSVARISFLPATFRRYSGLSRAQKTELFFSLLAPTPGSSLLDVGGGTGEDFHQLWAFFSQVIVLDINEQALKAVARDNPRVVPICADACDIPLPDQSVDYVFSNAVIEHIPRHRRSLFAREIRRVARHGYFVTTPNYWFPYEPHYQMPLYQYLPWRLKKLIGRFVGVGHVPKGELEEVYLLTASELRQYFPKARLEGVKVSHIPVPATIYAAWSAGWT